MRRRKRNRLKGYDYSTPRYYFVTICVKDMRYVFGEVINGKMILNRYGKIVKGQLTNLSKHYNCMIDEYVIMPNHIHAIIIIDENVGNDLNVGNGLKPFPTNTEKQYNLSEIVRGFKTFSSKNINKILQNKFHWQKSFYDRIIRTELQLNNIRQYIIDNPAKWDLDKNNLK